MPLKRNVNIAVAAALTELYQHHGNVIARARERARRDWRGTVVIAPTIVIYPIPYTVYFTFVAVMGHGGCLQSESMHCEERTTLSPITMLQLAVPPGPNVW